jgi:hypothetical protein
MIPTSDSTPLRATPQGMTERKQRRFRALERQATRLETRLVILHERSSRYMWWRLITFGLALLAGAISFFWQGPVWWLAITSVMLIPFGVVVAIHRRLENAIDRHEVYLTLKRQHLARMRLDWSEIPRGPEATGPPVNHPFAADLDVTGDHSLHQLLNTPVSIDGSKRLLSWLLETGPTQETTMARQRLVREIKPLATFRDKLSLNGRMVQGDWEGWDQKTLRQWLEAPAPADRLKRLLLVLGGLATLNIALLLLNLVGLLPPWWRLTLGIYFVLYLGLGREASSLFDESMGLKSALDQIQCVFQFLETYRIGVKQHLRAVCAPILAESVPPSIYLRRLSRVVAASGLSRNMVFWLVLNALFPWDLFFAYRLQQLRRQLAHRLPRWLEVWFELEAASALATAAYLNPHYTFPSLLVSEEVPFRARELGHPLIVDDSKVRNDYEIPSLGYIDLVTGSNMAGKSSFLRALGLNLALTYAGAATDAASLETQVFRLFSSIRVNDSVTDGISYFYAEVKRLKALLAALQADDDRPLFFLIDEIFRGTNNRERLLGSRAYLQALVGGDGVGVIATHDLELVQLASEDRRVRNFHFRDDLSDGRMVFDYQLRPGSSPTTNALLIMQREGLPVPSELEDEPKKDLPQGAQEKERN